MLDLVAVMLDWIVRIVNISVFTVAVIAYFTGGFGGVLYRNSSVVPRSQPVFPQDT